MGNTEEEFEQWLLENRPTSLQPDHHQPQTTSWREGTVLYRRKLGLQEMISAVEACERMPLEWSQGPGGEAILFGSENGQLRVKLVLPPLLVPAVSASSSTLVRPCPRETLVLLVQAGRASAGVWRPLDPNPSFSVHKTWTTYMVKKREGCTDQLTFDRRGGGMSTEGSRLRRENARRFFKKINSRLAEWHAEGLLARCEGACFYAAPLRMWNEVHGARPSCPIARGDPRWRKLRMPIGPVTHTECERAARSLASGGVLTWDAESAAGLLEEAGLGHLCRGKATGGAVAGTVV